MYVDYTMSTTSKFLEYLYILLYFSSTHLFLNLHSQSYLCRKVQLMHNLMSLPSNLLWIDYSSTFEFETQIRTYRENFRFC
jgi:hypothetical protein